MPCTGSRAPRTNEKKGNTRVRGRACARLRPLQGRSCGLFYRFFQINGQWKRTLNQADGRGPGTRQEKRHVEKASRLGTTQANEEPDLCIATLRISSRGARKGARGYASHRTNTRAFGFRRRYTFHLQKSERAYSGSNRSSRAWRGRRIISSPCQASTFAS